VTQRLLLIRHGVTEWNREGRFQGHLDPPLAEDGRTEAALLATRIASAGDLRPERLVSSPLARALQTAETIARSIEPNPPTVSADPRWMEIGQGEWEGRTHRELAATDGTRYAAWRARAGELQPPGAEPVDAALQRVSRALADLLATGPWPLAIISHGGTLRLAARRLLGLEPLRAWALDIDNASLSILERDDSAAGWRIERWNDTGHLLGRASLHVDEAEGEPLAF
jgi:broad specificity phosphatase PhoE